MIIRLYVVIFQFIFNTRYIHLQYNILLAKFCFSYSYSNSIIERIKAKFYWKNKSKINLGGEAFYLGKTLSCITISNCRMLSSAHDVTLRKNVSKFRRHITLWEINILLVDIWYYMLTSDICYPLKWCHQVCPVLSFSQYLLFSQDLLH